MLKTLMKYKGYVGKVEYDSDAKIFHGEAIHTEHQACSERSRRSVGSKDVITFQGKTVNELEKAFKDSINDYLEWCEVNEKKKSSKIFGKKVNQSRNS
jgi:predicted HicB family RNase H-like nuclease